MQRYASKLATASYCKMSPVQPFTFRKHSFSVIINSNCFYLMDLAKFSPLTHQQFLFSPTVLPMAFFSL